MVRGGELLAKVHLECLKATGLYLALPSQVLHARMDKGCIPTHSHSAGTS